LYSKTCLPELHLLQEVLPSLSAGAAEKIAMNFWNPLADDGCRFIGPLERLLQRGYKLSTVKFPGRWCIRKGLLPPAENRLTARCQLQKYEH